MNVWDFNTPGHDRDNGIAKLIILMIMFDWPNQN